MLTIDVATIGEMVSPVQHHVLKGDCEALVSPLWSKSDIKRLETMQTSWTTDDELSDFQGAVVVATDGGQYTVPKGKGDSAQGWVAVVNDSVDLAKAAKQAKSQGATGLIIKCSDITSLDTLSRNAGKEKPELPAVFMDAKVAEELSEKGITMHGIEKKGLKKRTPCLRALGQMGAVGDDEDMDPAQLRELAKNATNNVFETVGHLMVEHHHDKKNTPAKPVVEQAAEEDGDAGQNGFKWKVQSNTHYLWSTGQGGATKMNVNFGKKAPPTAMKKVKIDAETGEEITDASQKHNHGDKYDAKPNKKASIKARTSRVSIVGVSFLDADDVKNKKMEGLGADLHDLHADMMEPDMANQPMDQLPDDSDFKIEYAFEEVEVGVGEQLEDVEDEDFIDDEGSAVGKFAVPASRFWMIIVGIIVSTVIICGFMYVLMGRKPKGTEKIEHKPENLQNDVPKDFDKQQFAVSTESLVVEAYRRLRGAGSVLGHIAARHANQVWEKLARN
jgi:hypothetical protein